jgi:predicted RNA binding protein YcfA (HicA-like mRNA interferase family)
MKSAELIKMPESAGWKRVRTKGSHHHFKHPDRPGLVTIPHPKSEIPTGTLRNIYRQAGWIWKE